MKRTTSAETFAQLLDAADHQEGQLRHFLEYRRNQLELALAQAGVAVHGVVLEIGGGISGQAVLLSETASMVVCTDLPRIESSHGGDISEAARLARFAPRVKWVAASAEALPLVAESVDLVFSSFVFEHIRDRPAAAREVRRVLKPGGRVIVTVPNRMEPIHRAIRFYLFDAPRQLAKILLVWSGAARSLRVPVRTAPPGRPKQVFDAIRVLIGQLNYPPHGAYPDRVTEIKESGPRSWDRLFEEAGLPIAKRFTISLEDYFGLFNDRLTLWWQRRLMALLLRFGRRRIAIILGHSYCLVARKQGF